MALKLFLLSLDLVHILHFFDASANLFQMLIGLNLTNSTLAPAQVAHPSLLITETQQDEQAKCTLLI